MLAPNHTIVVTTFRSRLRDAADWAKVQPTLFDGIETIDPNFIAKQAIRCTKDETRISIDTQIVWAF
jgi:hypothetical protein